MGSQENDKRLIKEMQTQTGNLPTPVRVETMKRHRKQVLARTQTKENSCILLAGCKFLQSLWKFLWKFLRRNKKHNNSQLTTLWSLGSCWKEIKQYTRDLCPLMLIDTLFSVAKKWNPTTDDWGQVDIAMEWYLTRKEEILPLHSDLNELRGH